MKLSVGVRIDIARSLFVASVIALGAACSGSSGANGGSPSDAGPTDDGAGSTDTGPGSPDGGSGDGSINVSNGTWTTITPLIDPNTDGVGPGTGTVTGLWFSSATNGDVSFKEGVVEHFNGPKTLDAIAQSGHNALPGPSDDTYLGLWATPSSLIAVNGASLGSLVTSTDKGKSFTYSKLFGTDTVPSDVSGQIQLGGISVPLFLLWLQPDSTGAWHTADTSDGVWSSPAAPSTTATFTLTWHPDGDIPVPNPLPSGDCQTFIQNGYFTDVPGQLVWVSPDGKTMIYPAGTGGDTPPGVCRSTNGGKDFVPVNFSNPPSGNFPWVILFTSATNGIAAYGSDADTPGSAYVYVTSDGGATWKAGSLPSSAANPVALIHAFASPNGTLWLGGGANGLGPNGTGLGLLLYKSTDGGMTWTDVSAKLSALGNTLDDSAPSYSRAGFALDDNNIWIGADTGFLAYSATGGT